MTDNKHPLTGDERIEVPDEITDAEIAGFIDRGGEAPTFHTILQVWREVLKPAAAEAEKKVAPHWANKITASYREVNFADLNYVRDSYFDKIGQLADILEMEIDSDEDCLSYATPEEDAAENAHHYKNLLLNWQLAVLSWELDWDCTDATAGPEIAAISEVHKMFFGADGLCAYLESIRFEFTEDDQQQLADALLEFRGEG